MIILTKLSVFKMCTVHLNQNTQFFHFLDFSRVGKRRVDSITAHLYVASRIYLHMENTNLSICSFIGPRELTLYPGQLLDG